MGNSNFINIGRMICNKKLIALGSQSNLKIKPPVIVTLNIEDYRTEFSSEEQTGKLTDPRKKEKRYFPTLFSKKKKKKI